jgi:hypothetical protein
MNRKEIEFQSLRIENIKKKQERTKRFYPFVQFAFHCKLSGREKGGEEGATQVK